jgi:transcriptional regulator with XRE-family HTH domain
MDESPILKAIFANNLRIRRKKEGLTQAQLSKKINVSTSFVTEIENARKAPSFSTIEKISRVLNAPSWSFFCEYGDKITIDSAEKEKLSFELKNQLASTIDIFFKTKI